MNIANINEVIATATPVDEKLLRRDEINYKISIAKMGIPLSDEAKEALRRAAANKPPPTAERILKARTSNTGKKRTPEQRQRMSEAQRNRAPVTDETRRRISEAKTGEVRSAETRAKMSASWHTRYATAPTCPHCKKLVLRHLFGRFHGDNCKLKPKVGEQ